MSIEKWWPELSVQSREWLVEHNGEPVDPAVYADIATVTGGQAWTLMQANTGGGHLLADESVDWIEAAANDE
jgi:hypothetical protein